MKIERKQTVGEWSATSEGVTVNTVGALTWDEWDELVKAIRKPTEYTLNGVAEMCNLTTDEARTVFGSEIYEPKTGSILPGDKVDGVTVDEEFHYQPITATKGKLTRKKYGSYEQVDSGVVQAGDYVWFCELGEYIQVKDSSIDKSVSSYYCILRKPGTVVSFSNILPGDKLNGVVVDKALHYTRVCSQSGTVTRIIPDGWFQVTSGLTRAGDQFWCHAENKLRTFETPGDIVAVYHCILRKKNG